MSVSCDTGTAALESVGAAFRLEAVFLCGLCTFINTWGLAHFVPFWSQPSHATKGYHQWCGCPQPLAPLVSPGAGLGPRCCATCASASRDLPPWRSRRTLTRFSTSLQKNMWSIKRCVHRSFSHWSSLWGAPMAMLWLRCRPKSAPENHAERQANTHMLAKFSHHVLHTDSQFFPPT